MVTVMIRMGGRIDLGFFGCDVSDVWALVVVLQKRRAAGLVGLWPVFVPCVLRLPHDPLCRSTC